MGSKLTVDVGMSYNPKTNMWYVESANVPGVETEAGSLLTVADRVARTLFYILGDHGTTHVTVIMHMNGMVRYVPYKFVQERLGAPMKPWLEDKI